MTEQPLVQHTDPSTEDSKERTRRRGMRRLGELIQDEAHALGVYRDQRKGDTSREITLSVAEGADLTNATLLGEVYRRLNLVEWKGVSGVHVSAAAGETDDRRALRVQVRGEPYKDCGLKEGGELPERPTEG